MRTLLFLAALLAFASCSKDDAEPVVQPTWSVDGKTATAKVFLPSTFDVQWFDVEDPTTSNVFNSIKVEFSRNVPQVAGSYDIGGSGTSSTYIKTITAVSGINSASPFSYVFNTGSKTGTATITTNNSGRRFLSFSGVTVQKLNSTGQVVGSSSLSATELEY
jgi:hypothetical protein